MFEESRFFRFCAVRLMQILWIAVVCDAAYILRCVLIFTADPAASVARGFSVARVPAMTEHILMSAALLLLGGTVQQLLRRTKR